MDNHEIQCNIGIVDMCQDTLSVCHGPSFCDKGKRTRDKIRHGL